MTKKCRDCGEVKPLDFFHKQSNCKQGVRPECKTCNHKNIRESLEARGVDKSDYMKKYRKTNMEKWKRTPEQQSLINERRRHKYKNDLEYQSKQKAKVKEFYVKNPILKKRQRLRKFGITIEEYDKIFDSQSGKCAICGHSDMSNKKVFPMVDHCHTNGHVRGILCSACNFGIGKFKDNINLLKNAITYLEERNKP